jgi:hypothetical protein
LDEPIQRDGRLLTDWGSCLGCRYPLRGLSSVTRCPECGRTFDAGDPRTMRLPRPPGWFVRRISRPVDRVTAWTPVAAFVLILWGARLPGWNNLSTSCGIIVWIAILIGHGAGMLLRALMVVCRALPRAVLVVDRSFQRRAAVMLFASALLLAFPLPTYIGFALSRGAFDRAAAKLLARPFLERPEGGRWIGLYYVDVIDRCPHGLEFSIRGLTTNVFPLHPAWGSDLGFIYKNEPGECVNHHPVGHHLGGNWYAAATR